MPPSFFCTHRILDYRNIRPELSINCPLIPCHIHPKQIIFFNIDISYLAKIKDPQMPNNKDRTPHKHNVIIIGTGFGGLGMGIKLKEAGIDDFLILEKANDVGGCWRENSYPGAACDVPSHLYSFSFEKNADWSRKYAPQSEIHAYLQHCAKKYNLLQHIRFSTELASATFDEKEGCWNVETTQGQCYTTKSLVTACGQLSQPAYPKIEGIERFKGKKCTQHFGMITIRSKVSGLLLLVLERAPYNLFPSLHSNLNT